MKVTSAKLASVLSGLGGGGSAAGEATWDLMARAVRRFNTVRGSWDICCVAHSGVAA